jgi:hypothetical protein
MQTKNIFFIALGTLGLLLIPLLANWPWTLSDFLIGGTLIFVTGLALHATTRKPSQYRIAGVITIVFLFLWLWAELAVGIFTNWGS